MLRLLAVEWNSPNPVDIVFFVILGVIIAICIGIYFLIPVINKKHYEEQRENLKKREVAFKANYTSDAVAEATADTAEAIDEQADKQE